MRIDRWFWLPIFCVVSLILHFTVVFVTRGLGFDGDIRLREAPSIEITFEPTITPPTPKEKKIARAEKKRRTVVRTPRIAVSKPTHVETARMTVRPIVRESRPRPTVAAAPRPRPTVATVPKRIATETPSEVRPVRTPARAVRRTTTPTLVENATAAAPSSSPRAASTVVENPKSEVAFNAATPASLPDPARATGGGGSLMHNSSANPLGDGLPNDRPDVRVSTSAAPGAKIKKSKRELQLAAAGLRPSSSSTRATRDNIENPSSDVPYAGGGSGGPTVSNTPRETGGLASASVLHVQGDNPLGDAIPDDKPGAGVQASRTPGASIKLGGGGGPTKLGGGGGSVASNVRGRTGFYSPDAPKGNLGYGGGENGTHLASAGPSTGGGGRGRLMGGKGSNLLGDGIGEDLPGAGPGSGGGVGGGAGGGQGPGSGSGIAGIRRTGGPRLAGSVARPGLRASGPGGGGRVRGPDKAGSVVLASVNGNGTSAGGADAPDGDGPPIRQGATKYGNVAKMLHNAVGAPGHGALFQLRPTDGTDSPVHIVYTMDTSGSMRDGDKFLKAKSALKKALSELRPSDTFNIIAFTREAATFQDDAVPATAENIAYARDYVDGIKIGAGTNISGAMDLALRMSNISYIYIMSDGEPNGGIEDFGKLRKYIREKNTNNIHITTLALGLGEKFPGMRLLKAIAEENGGTYDYVNVKKLGKSSGGTQ